MEECAKFLEIKVGKRFPKELLEIGICVIEQISLWVLPNKNLRDFGNPLRITLLHCLRKVFREKGRIASVVKIK